MPSVHLSPFPSHHSSGAASIRRLAAERGLTPATWIPEASEGRAEEATIRPARLIEDGTLIAHPVGDREPWPEPVAFLDGIQRYEVVAYAGASPVVWAEVGAGVRERCARRSRTKIVLRRTLLIARPDVLSALGVLPEGAEPIGLPESSPPHPVADFLQARRAVDATRGRLEVEAGNRYRRENDGWLIVDGSLTESPQWTSDSHMIGVAKSHSTLPFGGEELERYLRLPYGHRSTVFAPAGHNVAPVYSWALRLWPWEGRDLFHGLIRVEARAAPESIADADRISRWLLAERAPISTPDPRWDRLLYGIHDVEVFLRLSNT